MKQIIILDRSDNNRFRVVYWLVPPAARQPFYANSSATSVFTQASAAELTALQNGSAVERVYDRSYPAVATLNQVKTALISEYNAQQTALNADNPWDRYGTFFDGATWTAGGVA